MQGIKPKGRAIVVVIKEASASPSYHSFTRGSLALLMALLPSLGAITKHEDILSSS
jgi:hypothetical protein